MNGKVKPTQTSANVEEGETATVNAAYTNQQGTVRVNITGDGGAGRWRLKTEPSSTARRSGETVTVDIGQVTVTFTDVAGKTKPADKNATVEAGKTVTVAGEYTTPAAG